MGYGVTTAESLQRTDGILLSGKFASVIVALASAALAAVVIGSLGPVAPQQKLTDAADGISSPFADRFSGFVASTNTEHSILSSELGLKLTVARRALAARLQSGAWRTDLADEPKPMNGSSIPLPKSRPLEANVEPRSTAAESDPRTLLQKLSDLIPARYLLASAHPDGGLLGSPDLKALGYERNVAVYDISARAVYLPNGSKLEAHSGFGSLRDDPESVTKPNVGATPPGMYELKPRERLFHGVKAVRMIPLEGSSTFGRSGFLAHSYLLGPTGDSNGCVSIKNYESFLQAFTDGEIKRLVVVPSLNARGGESNQSPSQS
jgi:hypothetical protein